MSLHTVSRRRACSASTFARLYGSTGAYGWIRHPVYLGALLIWLGFGVGSATWWIVALTVAYVLPAYVVYMRDEEAMLEQAFGEEYRRYRSSVPMLVPRLARAPRSLPDFEPEPAVVPPGWYVRQARRVRGLPEEPR